MTDQSLSPTINDRPVLETGKLEENKSAKFELAQLCCVKNSSGLGGREQAQGSHLTWPPLPSMIPVFAFCAG